MTRRRTKKDKIIAQLRRQVNNKASVVDLTTSVDEESSEDREKPRVKVNKSPSLQKSSSSLFSYDPAFIRKDLIRTVILASIAFGIEIGLYITGK